MLDSPRLTQQQIQAICLDNDVESFGLDHDGVADAAARKALWTCHAWMIERADHEDMEGTVHYAAELFVGWLEELGIEAWEESDV